MLTVVKPPQSILPKCGLCGLYQKCRSPKMEVSGSGKKSVLIVGEAPGRHEDLEGTQFVGDTGRFLSNCCDNVGFKLKRDAILTNSLACFTGDVRVDSPSAVEIGYRREYSGSLLRIATKGGRFLTGTPNHPILTPRGWVALGLLKEGDDLICCGSSHGLVFGDSQVQNPPPQFEQFFQSLEKVGEFERMVGCRMDFHGDGIDGNVDVVTQDGTLGQRKKAAFSEHGGDFSLMSANECQSSCFGNSGQTNNSPVLTSGSFPASGSTVGSLSQPFSSFSPDPIHTELHRISSSSQWDTHSGEQHFQLVPTESERISQRLQSLSRVVTTDSIVCIDTVPSDQFSDGKGSTNGSCHVYNLQTSEGYYIANGIVVSNCRPPRNEITDDRWIEYCRPKVLQAIKEHDPTVIVCLGAYAVESVVGAYWKPDVGGIKRWAGFRIPCRKPNLWICPTFHPSYIMREKTRAAKLYQMVFQRHLKAAFDLAGTRPWDEVPDYASQVELIYETSKAAKIIRRMIEKGGVVAFDYETDRLKPDHPDARIICASICWNGKKTIAFPWHGEAVTAFRELMRSPVKKVSHNLRFEMRWTMRIMKTRIRNWEWDTLALGHVIDCRKGIGGLDFQAFVRLGQEDYDSRLESFMSARKEGGKNKNDSGNAPNNVSKIDLKSLLTYNGIDSLVSYLIYEQQERELGL